MMTMPFSEPEVLDMMTAVAVGNGGVEPLLSSDGSGNETSSSSPTSGLASFQHHYAVYHGYVSTLVCVVGVISNAFIIIVLTRRNMVGAGDFRPYPRP